MNHKNKVKIARRLLTRKEIQQNVSVFDSVGWKTRKEAIAERVKSQQGEAHERALEMKKKWAKNYDFCIECGQSEHPHHGKGLCTQCRKQAEQAATRRGENIYSTIHIACEVCGVMKDTEIPIKDQKRTGHVPLGAAQCISLKKLQKKFKESHELYGYC